MIERRDGLVWIWTDRWSAYREEFYDQWPFREQYERALRRGYRGIVADFEDATITFTLGQE